MVVGKKYRGKNDQRSALSVNSNAEPKTLTFTKIKICTLELKI